MSDRLQVLAIEPYYGLSHRLFLDGYKKYSKHDVTIWDLPPRKWKWRMRGSALHFAEKAEDIDDAGGWTPDVVFASDFLNLADWKATAPRSFANAPTLLYFHENQAVYPLGDKAPRDHHYAWINVSSAAAADDVLFNSSYHREAFLGEVDRVVRRMPDFIPEKTLSYIRQKSSVFPVGLDFEAHSKVAKTSIGWEGREPVILWNHRWEYDKDPDTFVDALFELERRGVGFQTIICGESFGKPYPAFEKLAAELPHRVKHMGFLPSADDYRRAVADSDIVISTAKHEFFGVSIVEAIYLGCLPVLPSDLSYLEIIPPHLHPLFLYRQETPLADFLVSYLQNPPVDFARELRDLIAQYHWENLAPALDERMEQLVTSTEPS